MVYLGAGIGKQVSSDFANRITEGTNTSPDRVKYLGDPVSMFDFNSTTVMPAMGFRWKIAHILIRGYSQKMLYQSMIRCETH